MNSVQVGWNLPQDNILHLSTVWQLSSNKLFSNSCGEEWNLDSGTRRSISLQSSHLFAFGSFLWMLHILGGKNDNIYSQAETPPLCFCITNVTYAHRGTAVPCKSLVFPKYEHFLEVFFSNSFMPSSCQLLFFPPYLECWSFFSFLSPSTLFSFICSPSVWLNL